MQNGKVKWFNAGKGFGFIAIDGSPRDIFIHVSELEKASLPALNEGQLVQFDIAPGRDGREAAVNIKLAV